ncbi:MAG: Gfo/Idh/MocA family oxidoreductase [Clostridia bacterium]|nr:Gfo/Idh/MocA family oxidoreductase [Clostridia bacterium]
MENRKLRVGIIGTGSISQVHMAGYKALPDRVEVVAACDINEKKLQKYCDRYGIPHRYTDYNEMCEKEHLDCVSVCTWNVAHKGATIAALRSGANVICEKPMAMNAKEAEEMKAVAEETGKLLVIGFCRRFGNDAAALKKYVDQGYFGDIYYAKATYLRRSGCPGGWFGDKKRSGGGPLVDLSVHVLDLVRYLSGLPKPISAYGSTYDNLGPDRASDSVIIWNVEHNPGDEYNVEDFATALIKFDNGLTVALETSFNLNIQHDTTNVQIFGTKAGATVDPEVEIFTQYGDRFVNIQPETRIFLDENGLFEAEIKGFVDAVEGIAPPRATADDGIAVMKIIDAVYESAKTGKSVEIKW